jgi:hypothetical protein
MSKEAQIEFILFFECPVQVSELLKFIDIFLNYYKKKFTY